MRCSLLAAGLLAFTPVHASSFSVSAGAEYFSWREYDHATGREMLEESGLRPVFGLTVSAERAGRRSSLEGRLYGGDVDYDGETLDDPPIPITTTTRYYGSLLEWSGEHFSGRTSFHYGVGVDWWTRDILGDGGYRETYRVLYGRLGFGIGREQVGGWQWRAGVKYPLDVEEHVDWSRFGFDDPHLAPRGDLSLYADLRYAADPRWDWILRYDGYRFGRSDPRPLTIGGMQTGLGVWQPESHQSSIAVLLRRRF